MNGELVGVWHRGRNNTHRFVYESTWLTSPRTRPLSLSMPMTPGRTTSGDVVAHYFDNLLPDDIEIRRRVANRFRTSSVEAFDLLQAIGRDCVGAVQLMPAGVEPTGFDRIDAQPMTERDVEAHLRGVVSTPGLGGPEDLADFRISIAGAQEKTALLRLENQWCKPLGATPTTHILKLPLGLVGGRRLDLTHSVENEWLCAQLLRALGLPVASAEMVRFGDQRALAVERFDRAWATTAQGERWIARIPQEDFCQTLGLPSSAKYESDGGPSMTQFTQVLRRSQNAKEDVSRFLRAQLAFWLLAATDGHAKNFSLFLLPNAQYRMTPLYDVLSVWPVVGKGPNQVAWPRAKLAMALRGKNAHYQLNSIQVRHWHAGAIQSGVEGVWEDMCAMMERVEAAIDAVQALLPEDFPKKVSEKVFRGMEAQHKHWVQGLALLA
ncbi:type II toxin-antitoxin system HipA family toxin [Roseateles terrae]|uniref:Serine/threonine-protein kinase HipA n=1 Tax=Roseateles terrae TaxID=431060 RepID=A0ABR6GUK3_9BURK|nr:type II toxin-antitoxin system HipA family toxin [Roseateles terrae]MBB3195786.1 serine/threonine-protein kinase HipA [Roseateles terrae]OWQ86774.1 toxin HipA [Roseateles terrae]